MIRRSIIRLLWFFVSVVFTPSILKAQSFNLSTVEPSAIPAGVTLEWHKALPVSDENLVEDKSAVSPGIYYAVYKYSVGCYSLPSPFKLLAPLCEQSTVNLYESIDSSAKPVGTIVSFHTAIPVSDENRFTADAKIAPIGNYYTAYFDPIKNCYSSGTPIRVIENTGCPILISGVVFHDVNGLNGSPANTIDGVGTNAGGLNAVLVDKATGKVVQSTAVGSLGDYSFTIANIGDYYIMITTNTALDGQDPPTIELPAGWANSGEFLGAGAGNDLLPNGILELGTVTGSIENAVFGIGQKPLAVDDTYNAIENETVTLTPLNGDSDPDGGTLSIVSINGTALTPGIAQTIAVTNGEVNIAADGTITFIPALNFFGTVTIPYVITDGTSTTTANEIINLTSSNNPPVAGTATAPSQFNPGGTVGQKVNADLFSGTDSEGAISTLTITSFPTNATSITIDGVKYNAGNFPAGGVTLTTNGTGAPNTSLPIMVDPVDGTTMVQISYIVTDDEGLTCNNTGTVNLPFMLPPDLTPTILVRPNIITAKPDGTASVNITIKILELNAVNTSGPISVIIPKDSRLNFTYNPNLLRLNFTNLNNIDWTYDGTNENVHIFRTNAVIPASGVSNIGIQATFTIGNTKGSATITSTIGAKSGSENKVTNNNNAEQFSYFPN